MLSRKIGWPSTLQPRVSRKLTFRHHPETQPITFDSSSWLAQLDFSSHHEELEWARDDPARYAAAPTY